MKRNRIKNKKMKRKRMKIYDKIKFVAAETYKIITS